MNSPTSPNEALKYTDSPRFATWKDIYDYYHDALREADRNRLWVFRGQANALWPLRTRLERDLVARHCRQADWRLLEEGLVREFRRRLSTADPTVQAPEQDDVIGWMALMQHHGAPTRLLDWTFSFFVALFFAVESASDDAAVFAIDARWCNSQARKLLPDPDHNALNIAGDPYVTTSKTFRSLFARSPEVPLVYRINTFALHPRLAIQQGLFLCPGSLSVGFESNLRALQDMNATASALPIRKLVIPHGLHAEVLRELGYMNIGRHTLFPGIDGFSQWLSNFLQQPQRLLPSWRMKRTDAPFEQWSEWKPWEA